MCPSFSRSIHWHLAYLNVCLLVSVCKDVYVLNVIWFTVDIEIKNLFAAGDETSVLLFMY